MSWFVCLTRGCSCWPSQRVDVNCVQPEQHPCVVFRAETYTVFSSHLEKAYENATCVSKRTKAAQDDLLEVMGHYV